MDYRALPVWTGDGNLHVNYFRTFIRPFPGQTLPTGAQLLATMPKFMDPHTASVWPDSRTWHGRATLMFRGKARVRPFMLWANGMPLTPVLPIPLPDELKAFGIPEEIRQMMIPQWHTDSVGLAMPPFPHSFTVQTLKREFETFDDQRIRLMVSQHARSANPRWQEKLANFANAAAKIINPYYGMADYVLDYLADWAVMINQHHFLAGRRSFLIGTVGGLGLVEPGTRPTDWVFETAAVERYSLATFGYATNLGMGGAARVVKPVWMEMGMRLARHYGQPIGSTVPVQAEFGNYAAAAQTQLFHHVTTRHKVLVPGGTPR